MPSLRIGKLSIYGSKKQIEEARILLKDVDTNKNTGQAQLLNTLLNQTKQNNKKEGPVFIYTQIPLNEAEQHAENVVMVDGIDPFENYK